MTMDIKPYVRAAVQAQLAEMDMRIGRLLVRPPVDNGVLWPAIQLDTTMPRDEIHLRQYGVTAGKIVNIAKDVG